MHDRRPKAVHLAEEIAAAIRRGEYAPDARLPTEAEARERYGVARATVRKAYESLADAGLIYSVRGHGWYVREDRRLRFPLLTIDAHRATATRDVWAEFLSTVGEVGDHYLANVAPVEPPDKVRSLLKLGPDEQAYARHRVRRVRGEPWMLSTGYYPAHIAYGTPLADPVDMQNPSPLRWLIEHGLAPVRHEDLISARMPDATEVDLLGLGKGTPVMAVYRTSWDRVGRPVRCTADVLPTHRFELVVTHAPPEAAVRREGDSS